MTSLTVVEICAGAGGQSLGLHRAGFAHRLAVELDGYACATLTMNHPEWDVRQGDVADREVWDPAQFEGVDLLAGGVPCPPFSIAGKKRGGTDERDLFAWTVEQLPVIQPRALLLENVRGLAAPRFAAYRQRILDRLAEFGYVGNWTLLQAADFGVPQLRPRFVLVAMKPNDAEFFAWPRPQPLATSVGEALKDLMGANGWRHLDEWVAMASGIGPTLVGGSKKHGGADLGPTRAKAAWKKLGVDAMGLADEAPAEDAPHPAAKPPKLTVPMVARLQGWDTDTVWELAGRKTAQYRQVGNAFPPPVAEAVGTAIRRALEHDLPEDFIESPLLAASDHDPVYRALAAANGELVAAHELRALGWTVDAAAFGRHMDALAKDFHLRRETLNGEPAYALGEFKGFIGQANHERHLYMEKHRSRIS